VQHHRRGDGRDRQVQTLYPQRGQPDHQPAQHGDEAAGQQVEQHRRAQFLLQRRDRVGADAHKGGLPQAHQPGVAGEDVEPGGAGDVDRHQAGQVKPVLVGQERKAEQRDGEDGQPGVLGAAVEQRLVMAVTGACGSDTHYNLSISWVPNRP
jgi:hypothetical protein